MEGDQSFKYLPLIKKMSIARPTPEQHSEAGMQYALDGTSLCKVGYVSPFPFEFSCFFSPSLEYGS